MFKLKMYFLKIQYNKHAKSVIIRNYKNIINYMTL